MSMQEGLAILERAAQARGKILRVEGDRAGSILGRLLLTFDVGRVHLGAGEDGIEIEVLADPTRVPPGLGPLDEEEPWWRLLGQPLTAAWPGGVEAGVGARGLGSLMVLKLRFREQAENPRIVVVEATGTSLRVGLDAIRDE